MNAYDLERLLQSLNNHISNEKVRIDIYETSDCYGDSEGEDEILLQGKPYFEGCLINDEDGEPIDDTHTGRYLSIHDVIDETLEMYASHS